ncbi:MAG: tetratricopeptide repeat protein [Crocosphaera sp.]|nr:tetratricopeptide repeat protein [Crocosphaera sp.]
MNLPSKKQAVQFSQSKIWQQQNDFYQQTGIDAWDEKIPYQITNNLILVNAYANLIFDFFKEYSSRYPTDLEPNPFIIVELGAGSGIFGAALIKQLLELQTNLDRPDIEFKYIMTDFSAKNISFWRQHPTLREYIDLEVLDFAEYDIGKTANLKLVNSGLNLRHSIYSSEYTKPWIVIANYVFDTTPQDIFQVKDETLSAGLIDNKIPNFNQENFNINEPKSFQKLGIKIEYQSVDVPYYKVKDFDQILANYKDSLDNHIFLFPINALKAIKNLIKLSGKKLLLLATDKASIYQPPLISEETQDIIFHNNSFSMVVNFDAISAFFEAIDGAFLHQPINEYINTSLFLVGEYLGNYFETQQSFLTHFNTYNPFSLFNFSSQLESVIAHYTISDLLSYLNWTHWDTEVINRCINIIVTATKELDAISLKPFIEGMHRCADNFYYLPYATSTFVNVGTFFQEIKDFETALQYYEKSIAYFGRDSSDLYKNTLYNMALCYYHLGDQKAALEHFHLANKASPTPDMIAKGWIYYLTEEIQI